MGIKRAFSPFLMVGTSVSLSYDGYVLATGASRFELNVGGCWVFLYDGANYRQVGDRIIGSGYVAPDVFFGKIQSWDDCLALDGVVRLCSLTLPLAWFRYITDDICVPGLPCSFPFRCLWCMWPPIDMQARLWAFQAGEDSLQLVVTGMMEASELVGYSPTMARAFNK